jgi:hypothetical protein
LVAEAHPINSPNLPQRKYAWGRWRRNCRRVAYGEEMDAFLFPSSRAFGVYRDLLAVQKSYPLAVLTGFF